MVWNSAGSTLYKAVERHNTDGGEPQHIREPSPGPPHYNKAHTPSHRSSPLSQLTQDKDMLLLLAVLLVLLHEKADTKLIMALAFVIFC